MSKRPRLPDGKCVHCLAENVPRTWDHVFPKSYYPDGNSGEEKWQVPSCQACNSTLGKIEEEFLRKIAPALDPNAVESRGLWDTVLRSMNPNGGRDENDVRIRHRLRSRFQENLIPGEQAIQAPVYPGMGPSSDEPIESQLAIRVDFALVAAIGNKIVRGIWHVESDSFIEPPYAIVVRPPEAEMSQKVTALLDRESVRFERPGIAIRSVKFPDDSPGAAYEIELWRTLKMYAFVTKV